MRTVVRSLRLSLCAFKRSDHRFGCPPVAVVLNTAVYLPLQLQTHATFLDRSDKSEYVVVLPVGHIEQRECKIAVTETKKTVLRLNRG